MASPVPDSLNIKCPGCGARFVVSGKMVGRQGRCAACGKVLRIEPAGTTAKTQPAGESDDPGAAGYVSFECHVCQTRLAGRLRDIGRKVKCPDCGALTAIPPPTKIKPKKPPRAMEGEQYELWEPESQAWRADKAASQSRLIRVVCGLCETLMYATEDQVGQELVCPDCNTRTVVPPPAEEHVARPAVLVEAYRMDETQAPVKLPPAIDPDVRRRIYEEERMRLDPESSVEGKRKRRQRRDERGRPLPPRWPMLLGIWSFPLGVEASVRWVALTGAIVFWAMPSLLALALYQQVGPGPGGFGAIGAVCFLALALIMLVLWYLVVAAHLLAILVDSSEGLNEIENWPTPYPVDHIFEGLYLPIATAASAIPGWGLATLMGADPLDVARSTGGSMFLLFPFFLLSALDFESPLAILSPRVLRAMLRCLGSMTLLYVQSVLLAVCLAMPLVAAVKIHDTLLLALAPVGMGVAFVYFRLLGRLGWCLGEATPAEQQE